MRLWLKPSMLIVWLTAFFCVRVSAAEPFESVSLASSHFAKHQFSEGQSVLTARLGDDEVSSAERAAILGLLGDFYCDYAGDYSTGFDFYQRAAELHPDPDGFKNEQMEAIVASRANYADIDRIIEEIKSQGNVTTPDTLEKIKRLQRVVIESPDYYRIAEAHYCIAMDYAVHGQNVKALSALKRAESAKPAVAFFLPLHGQREVFQARLNRLIATRSSIAVFGFMILLSAVFFFLAKPWRWLTFRMIGGFALLLAALNLIILLVGAVLSALYINSDSVQQVISGGERYFFTAIYSPGGTIYGTLLLYMAAAFFITYVFALGTFYLIRQRAVAAVLNGLAGTLIMASLVCMFYMRHCDLKTYEAPVLSLGGFFSTAKAMLFVVKGIEPCLLTDPEAFPNLGISHNPNGALEKWAEKHCPFTKTEGQ